MRSNGILNMYLNSSWLITSTLFLLVFVLYKYMTRHFNYWKQRGVYHEKPLPFFGNTLDVFLFKCSLGDWLRKKSHAIGQRYYGIFVFDKPCLVINDPDLLKHILIKDFNVFRNRSVASGDHDEIMRELMFFQKDPNWRAARVNISPIYSSGRLKRMFLIINQNGKDFEEFIERHLGDNDDIKELVSRWSLEVISQTTFGIRPNSFKEKTPEFVQFSEKLFEHTIRNSFVQLCYFFKQEWVEPLRLIFFPKDALQYFKNTFTQTMESRKQSGFRFNDLIDIMNEAKSKGKLNISESVLSSSAIQVFIGGYETMSTTIAFFLYELATHQDVQKRLRKEIIEVTERHGGLSYEALSEMKYMDMCLTEVLRKYPILPLLDRVCGEDYKIPGTDLVIDKGMNVYIPIYAFHFNEQFYPDPYTFNPDRFAEGKDAFKDSMKYLSFGAGPRVCLGERFGIMACKTCISYFLAKFEVVPNSKTQERIKFSVKSQLTTADGGLPMRIKKYVS